MQVKIGQRYATKEAGNFFANEVMTVLKVENGKGESVKGTNDADGFVYWRSSKKMHNRINQSGRVWWFKDHCVLISSPNN